MKPIKHLLVRMDKFQGANLGDSKIYVDHTYNPEKWVPTRGVVVAGDDYFGETVLLDYYGVIRSLGRWFNPAAETKETLCIVEDGVFSVFIKKDYVFAIEKDGDYIPVGGYQIVEPIKEEQSDVIQVVKLSGGPTRSKELVKVLIKTGEHAGKIGYCAPHSNRAVGLNGHEGGLFEVVHDNHIWAVV